jgi:hypothetical protein
LFLCRLRDLTLEIQMSFWVSANCLWNFLRFLLKSFLWESCINLKTFHAPNAKKKTVCHVPLSLPLQKFASTLAQSLWKLESCHSLLMYLILRILKFGFLRVPSCIFRPRKVKPWVFSANFSVEKIWLHLFQLYWGPKTRKKYSEFWNLIS